MSGPERLTNHPVLGAFSRGPRVAFSFDGTTVNGHEGEPIGAALLAVDTVALRVSRSGEPRGLHCAIGQCMECRVEIEGVGVRRACLTPVTAGLVVRTHRAGQRVTDA